MNERAVSQPVKCKNINKHSNKIQMLCHRKLAAPISHLLKILSYFHKFSNIAKYVPDFITHHLEIKPHSCKTILRTLTRNKTASYKLQACIVTVPTLAKQLKIILSIHRICMTSLYYYDK